MRVDSIDEMWKLGKRRGSGGFGVVHEAQREGDSRTYAVKMLLDAEEIAEDFSNEEATRRFRREIALQQSLDHPNVLPVLLAGPSDDPPWFAMPLARCNLLTRIEEGLTEAEIETIFAGILAGVAHAHQQGVLHRDLKPDNVLFLVDDDTPKLADFGLARNEFSKSTRFTKIGFGTQPYTAPEQWDDPANVDERADVYSLGKILQEMVTATPPLRTTTAKLPGKYRNFVLRAAAEDLAERYQSVGDMIEAFRQVCAGVDRPVLPGDAVADILRRWGETDDIPTRDRVLKDAADLLESEWVDDDFMREVVPALPVDLLKRWLTIFPASAARVVRRYVVAVDALPLTGFPFTYLDDVADVYENVILTSADGGLKRDVLRSLLRTGLRYTENDCAAALGSVIEHVGMDDVLLVAEGLEAEPAATLWLQRTGVLDRRRVPAPIASAISRVAAEVLVLEPRALQELSSYHGLTAHYSDDSTVPLRRYPTAVRVTAPTPDGPLAISTPDESITVEFVAPIRGLSFRYQQGLHNAEITVRFEDGTLRFFSGTSFFPESATLALLAPGPIASVSVRSNGTFVMQEFIFYATMPHARGPLVA
jgi:hypothetical protein